MRLAFSYKRFSSPKQARGDSLRRQTAFEQEVVRDMSLVLDESLDLTDRATSAFRGDNAKFGALSRFLDLVRDKDPRVPPGSVLLIENLDRLSRQNVAVAFKLFIGLLEAGITIVTAMPREVYTFETVSTDVSKVMVPLVYMMRAHDESLQKSRRLHAAWTRRRERALTEGKPLTGRCPAWLVANKDGYEVVPDRAETVRLIFRWVQEGLGLHRITQRLVRENRKPFGRTGRWNETYVRKLLTWPAVHGEFQPHLLVEGKKVPHGPPVPDYFPAVVGKDEFAVAQATMSDRKGKDGRRPGSPARSPSSTRPRPASASWSSGSSRRWAGCPRRCSTPVASTTT